MHMTVTVAVAGASGYAGGEFLRLAQGHPHLELGALTAHTQAGLPLGAVHPHIPALAHRTLLATTIDNLAHHDVVVLALPHGASAEIAAQLPATTLVIDLGADHRLADPHEWEHYYGSSHAGTWPYGMPELIRAHGPAQRQLLGDTRRIAVPGCNVTAVTLATQPFVASPHIDTTALTAVLAVGYSGAGKTLKPHLLAAEALGSAQPYAVGGSHRHIPEIVQNLSIAGAENVAISFTPVLVPMSRGILATVTAPPAPGVTPATDELHAHLTATYAHEPFVDVLPPGVWPSTATTTGANTAYVNVTYDQRANRIVMMCALDNLVKGTAGAAIQSLNIAQGLTEQAGLTTTGVAP